MKNKSKKISKNEQNICADTDIDYTMGDEEIDANSNEISSKIKKIQKELQECKKERQEYLLGWQRSRADLINERKDFEKKSSRISSASKESFLIDLIPTLDSFDMAFANKEAWKKVDKTWRTGIEYIHSHLLSVLTQNGFTTFQPKEGELFNPSEHESLETTETQEKKNDGKIVSVLQKGYRTNNSIIRPAKVKVMVYSKQEIK